MIKQSEPLPGRVMPQDLKDAVGVGRYLGYKAVLVVVCWLES